MLEPYQLRDMFPKLYQSFEGDDDIMKRLQRLSVHDHRKATAMLALEGRSRARDLIVQMANAQERADYWRMTVESDHRSDE